jgi:hypothetical protein
MEKIFAKMIFKNSIENELFHQMLLVHQKQPLSNMPSSPTNRRSMDPLCLVGLVMDR